MKSNLTAKKSSRLLGLPFWLVITATFIVSRMATWFFPFDSDHWIFAYIGRIWAEGGTLYIDAWDHKSPLVFAYNGLLYKLVGDDIVLSRIIFTMVSILSAWLFYKAVTLLLKQLSKDNYNSLAKITTLIFIILTNTSEFTNSGNNNENIAILFLTATVYLYLRYRQSRNFRLLIGSGLLAGFVFMFKVNFSILLLPILIDIIYQQLPNVKLVIRNLLLFSIGIIAQVGFWVLYFYQMGTLGDFLTAAYIYNSKYIRALGWDLNEPGLLVFIGILALLLALVSPFAVRSLQYSLKNKSDRKSQLIVAMMSISVIIFILTAGTFYSYYFLIIMPYICLIIASSWPDLRNRFGKKLVIYVSIILFIFMALSYRQLYNNFSGSTAEDAINMNAAALYVKEHTTKNDTIFANMYGATFYQLAQRDSGSRFISASYLLVDNKFNFGYNLNAIAINDLEKSKPKYIIISSSDDDLYITKNMLMTQYFNSHYHLEKTLPGYKILVRN